MSSSRSSSYSTTNPKNTEQIKKEIKRFEGVHPSIYSCYDLLDVLPEQLDDIRDQLKDHIQSIEDAFVNSHEWTLSRGITELHLGVIGHTGSGRTTLIHRYLTGKFDAVESAEGGRYKNEFIQDGQSHLLLIRDEGDARPSSQFANWVDAVIFVYAVDNAETFKRISDIYYDLTKYRNLSDMPLVLVGTQDTHNEMSPRVITEEQGHQMANRLKRCSYYETNSTFGLNVERVFKDVCARIIQHRRYSLGGARTPTPTTPAREADRRDYQDSRMFSNAAVIGSAPAKGQYHQRSTSYAAHEGTSRSRTSNHVNHREASIIQGRVGDRAVSAAFPGGNFLSNHFATRSSQMADFCGVSPSSSQKSIGSLSNGLHTRSSTALIDTPGDTFGTSDAVSIGTIGGLSAASASTSHLPTPSSTPTTQRKNRRISNIFQRPKENHEEKNKAIEALNHGVGRAIPIKQGHLYKKTTKSALNREWKKKYVCLYSDGRLTYHQSLKEYMDKSTGKEVFLGLATVKVAGRAVPRNTQRMGQSQTEESASASALGCSLSGSTTERKIEVGGLIGSGEGTSGGGSDDAKEKDTSLINMMTPQTVPGQKKRRGAHRRLGSSGKHADEEEECFEILTSDQKRWEFCAMSAEERDEWVCAIEEQIEKALQNQLSTPSNRAHGNRDEVQALRNIPGNSKCADCSSPHPDWASLNLGTLICIECSGVHRNLGSHVSRVRSLELDDWPVECLAVMQAIGNEAANKLWEFNAPLERKPASESSREQKEQWIRSKYEMKRFLPPLRVDETVSRQLIAAVLARDVTTASLLLARASTEDVNCPLKDGRTPLHLAASIGSLEMVQLLLWNNADMLLLDEEGRSCLWHAKHQGSTECAELLVTAGMSPGYGCPSTAHTNHQQMMISDGAIMGSMTNRDYSCYGEDVKMRRPVVSLNSKRNDAFDLLPASII